MVRWKRKKRAVRHVRIVPAAVSPETLETPEDVEEDEDDVEEVYDDGEEEDNYRSSLIRMTYISIGALVLYQHWCMIFLVIGVELTAWHNRSARAAQLKEKNDNKLRDPPMSEILSDTMKYRTEIEQLKKCNQNLTVLSYANIGLELSVLSYSSLLFDIDRHHLYPFSQFLLYLFSRCHHILFDDIYGRFFGPEDIVGALLVEVSYFSFSRNRTGPAMLFGYHIQLTPSPLAFLLFPLVIGVLQIYANYKHEVVYASERNIRRKIRDRYMNGTPPHLYDSIF